MLLLLSLLLLGVATQAAPQVNNLIEPSKDDLHDKNSVNKFIKLEATFIFDDRFLIF